MIKPTANFAEGRLWSGLWQCCSLSLLSDDIEEVPVLWLSYCRRSIVLDLVQPKKPPIGKVSFHLVAAHNAQLLLSPSIALSEELTREQAFLAQGRTDGAPQVLHPVWPAKRQRETRIDEIARGQEDILKPSTNWGQSILEV
jgi:hypothetical protein